MVKRTHWGSAVKLPAKRWASPKNVGCARTSRHDHSCVLLRKRRRKSEEKFSVIDTSATIELKTARNTCHLNLIHGSNGASFASKPILESRDGALSQVIAYTVSDVWTCLARTGMKIDGQTPNRVRFGFLACTFLHHHCRQHCFLRSEPRVLLMWWMWFSLDDSFVVARLVC